jgi:hypothetical protein
MCKKIRIYNVVCEREQNSHKGNNGDDDEKRVHKGENRVTYKSIKLTMEN